MWPKLGGITQLWLGADYKNPMRENLQNQRLEWFGNLERKFVVGDVLVTKWWRKKWSGITTSDFWKKLKSTKNNKKPSNSCTDEKLMFKYDDY